MIAENRTNLVKNSFHASNIVYENVLSPKWLHVQEETTYYENI